MCSRLPIPAAYLDPAFLACLQGAIDTSELVENVDRLYGTALMGGKASKADLHTFSKFVHESIYLRLPDEAIAGLRKFKEASHA